MPEAAAYWPTRDMALDHDHCFLCGVELTSQNRTDEHVFPRWLQRDYNLWNEQLTLLNRSTIRYRALTIPCCTECNEYWLSQVENQVAPAFRSGPDAVRALDRTVLGLWMAKIYYGIHFKELALPEDRRSPDGAPIVPAEYLARFSELHHVLQATRRRVRFEGAPASIRIFGAQVPPQREHQFDYRDLRVAPFLGIRAGATVVLASLLDWGAMDGVVAGPFDAAEQLELHPVQFAEIAAFAAYMAMQFNREFAYLFRNEGDHDVLKPVIVEYADGPDPARPVFDQPRLAEEARVLAEFMGFELHEVYDAAAEQLWTTLRNQAGDPNTISLDLAPIGVRVAPPGWTPPPA